MKTKAIYAGALAALLVAAPALAIIQDQNTQPSAQAEIPTEIAQLPGYAEMSDRELKRVERYLSGRKPVSEQSCISRHQSQDMTVISDDILVFGRHNDDKIYVNMPYGGCNDADNNALVYSRPTSQLCSGEIARVVDFQIGASFGSCAFSHFTVWEKPAADDANANSAVDDADNIEEDDREAP